MNFGQFIQLINNVEQNLHRIINNNIVIYVNNFGDYSGDIVLCDLSTIEINGLKFLRSGEDLELSFDNEETMVRYLETLANYSEKMSWEEFERFCDKLQMETTKWLE